MRKLFTKLFLGLFFLFFSFTSFGQEPCATHSMHDKLKQTSPEYREQLVLNERKIQEYLASPRAQQRSSSTYTIPVVVHIIHLGETIGSGTNISDAQINSAIDRLNDIYDNTIGTSVDTDISFVLASRMDECNIAATTGINRVDGTSVTNYSTQGIEGSNGNGADEVTIKALSNWDQHQYLNIWVVSEIDNNGGGSGVQGYAYYPGAPNSVDGIVVLYNTFGYDPGGSIGYNLKSYTNLGATLAHEVGHYLNLRHTFQGDDGNNDGVADQCPADTDCSTGDCVADTDPFQRVSSCSATGNNSCASGSLIEDQLQNYMGYSGQSCKDEFTAGQVARMQAAMMTLRPGLVYSQGASTITSTEPIAPNCSPNTTNLANGFGLGIELIEIGADFGVGSNGAVEDQGYRDRWCQHTRLDGGTNYTIEINNSSPNVEDVRVYIDYNNNGDFIDSGEEVFSSNNGTSHSGSFTTPTDMITETPLRLRAISDFTNNTISGPCYTPQYGQVEDYSVTFNAPLPVEWLSFDAERVNNQTALTWQVANEYNNEGFLVERSNDGKQWGPLEIVYSKGNYAGTRTYQYMDSTPMSGTNYYRIKQKDLDGAIDISSIVQVNFKDELNISVVPNPVVTDELTLFFSLAIDQPVTTQIFDVTGKLLHTQVSEVMGRQLKLACNNMIPGVYFVSIDNGLEVRQLKWIKQ